MKTSNLNQLTTSGGSNLVLIHILKPILIGSLLIFCFTQCVKNDFIESHDAKHSNQQLEPRTCSPGDLIVYHGRSAFDSNADYVQTIEFLRCADSIDIADWSDELGITTVGKAYRSFESQLNENLSSGQFSSLMESFDGKVIFSENEDTIEYAPLFPILTEICNLNGEFQVGSAIIKLTENKIISITDPETINPTSVDDETVTDTTDGVFVYDLRASVEGGGCCPSYNSHETQWGHGPRKRLWVDYEFFDASVLSKAQNGQYYMTVIILLNFDSKSEKRVGFWPFYSWVPNNGYCDLSMDMTFSHNYSSFLDSPLYPDWTLPPTGPHFVWGFEGDDIFSNQQSAFAKYRPPSTLEICVEEVNELFSNYTEDRSSEIDCD